MSGADILQGAEGATGTVQNGVYVAQTHIVHVLHRLHSFHRQADHYAQFALLPCALVLFIVHEYYRSTSEGSSFRVGYVAVRTAGVVGLLLGYAKLCALITSIGGGGSGWLSGIDYANFLNGSTDWLSRAWDDGGLSGILSNIGFFLVWFILLLSVLFAFVAGALLGQIQVVTIALLLSVGKLCIAASLVPGVSLGKSWARALAQCAAWSVVGGVLLGLLGKQNAQIGSLIAAHQYVPVLKVAADFVITGLMTWSVPIVTSKLFSGGAAAWGEVVPSLLALRTVGRGASRIVSTRPSSGRREDGSASAGASGGGSPSGRSSTQRPALPRPHKLATSAAAFAGAVRERWNAARGAVRAGRFGLARRSAPPARGTARSSAAPDGRSTTRENVRSARPASAGAGRTTVAVAEAADRARPEKGPSTIDAAPFIIDEAPTTP